MKCVAYYLGQFHPIAENNQFWGEGFTEWHNVSRARPLYPSHRQPVLPGRLGFYDLRHRDTLLAQLDLAADIGVDALCHWHYWFGGKRLLHSPLDDMIALRHPRTRFMLGWANESWSGVWHGASNHILIEQVYHEQELVNHARLLARYIQTGQYLQTDGAFPFVIYKPRQIPDPVRYLDGLREHLYQLCGASLYIIGNWSPGRSGEIVNPRDFGLDAVVITPVAAYFGHAWQQNAYSLLWQALRRLGIGPEVRSYRQVSRILESAMRSVQGVAHASVVTGWDNTPRSGRRGLVLRGYDEASFRDSLEHALAAERLGANKILFVKSWNEWAEGNVLEPRFNENWSAAEVFRAAIQRERGCRHKVQDALNQA